MPTDRAQELLAPDAPFRFVGGDSSLDFVNTADWTERGLERDRFTSYDRLLEWGAGAGVLGAADARRLRRLAAAQARRAEAALEAAHHARSVLRETFASMAAGRLSTNAVRKLNALIAAVAPHTRMVRGSDGRLVRGWEGFGASLESILWPVVWSAADLASSPEIGKLRLCAGSDCGWLYIDRSRNGLRRWCEMSVCGTAEKNRRRALT